jgi:hypothetical protein
VQLFTSPVRERRVSRSSLQPSARLWHVDLGSRVSPASIAPLSQTAEHSASLTAVQAGLLARGQQRSPLVQVVIFSSSHRTLQRSALPTRRCRVQVISGQPLMHSDGGSQVSPGSTRPLPQVAGSGSGRAGPSATGPGPPPSATGPAPEPEASAPSAPGLDGAGAPAVPGGTTPGLTLDPPAPPAGTTGPAPPTGSWYWGAWLRHEAVRPASRTAPRTSHRP